VVEPMLLDILRRHLGHMGPEEVLADDAVLKDLGLDSQHAVELMFDLEEAFDIMMPDSALTAETFRTPATIAAAVREALADR
jgi:acyl carrier protein